MYVRQRQFTELVICGSCVIYALRTMANPLDHTHCVGVERGCRWCQLVGWFAFGEAPPTPLPMAAPASTSTAIPAPVPARGADSARWAPPPATPTPPSAAAHAVLPIQGPPEGPHAATTVAPAEGPATTTARPPAAITTATATGPPAPITTATSERPPTRVVCLRRRNLRNCKDPWTLRGANL